MYSSLNVVIFQFVNLASTYPCVWCTLPQSEFNSDVALEGGDLRDMLHIRVRRLLILALL